MDVQKGGAGSGLIVSGSDDGTVRVWNDQSKEEVEVAELGYPITSVSIVQARYKEAEGFNADIRRDLFIFRSNGPRMANPSTSEE